MVLSVKSEMKRTFSVLAFCITFVTGFHQEVPFDSYLVTERPLFIAFLMLHSTSRNFHFSSLYELSTHVCDHSKV